MSEPGETAATSQIRGSALLLAGQMFAVIVNLAVQVLIVRYLSQESYGAFAYALSIALVGESVARFGMRRGVARYMPIYEESGDLGRAAGTFVLAITTVLGLGLAVVLLIAALRGTIAGTFADDSTAVTLLVLLALMAPIEALGSLLDAVFAVFSRPRAIVIRRFVLTPLFRLGVVILLLLGDHDVVFLAAGYVATGLLGLGLYAPLLVGTLRERRLLGRLRPGAFTVPAREVLGFTVPLLSSDLTGAAMTAAGGIALGLLATPGDVAELRAVLPIALTMGYVLTSFGLLLVPFAARLYARGESEELNAVYWRTAVWTAVVAFPIFLVCVVLAEPLTVLLFGERYATAAPVLAVLAAGQFVNTAAGNNGVVLGVFKRVRFIATTNLVAIAAILVAMLALVPPFGAVGAAAATSATFVVLNVVRQLGLGRQTAVRAMPPAARGPYAVMGLATGLLLAIELLLSPPTAVAAALIAVAVILAFAVARHGLALAETFPELARVPLLRRLLGATTGGPAEEPPR